MIKKVSLLGLSLIAGAISWGTTAMAEGATNHEIEDALALTADAEKGKAIFETCALCHTAEGWGSALGRFPQLSGQHASVIIKQLSDIRSGNRDNPTMFPFTQSKILKTPQDIANVAAYISKLPMTVNNGKGSGFELPYGEKLYKDNCVRCHGDNGEGDNEKFYPRIQGQHYQYLLRQMIWIQIGKRRNADDKMVKQIHGFGLRELDALADYTSRIKPADDLLAAPDWKNPDFSHDMLTAPKVQAELSKK